jgi:tetratricopeptide (TPR) repeat protein
MTSVALAAILLTGAAPPLDLAAVERAVAAAERRWDADAAVAALGRARSLAKQQPAPATRALQLKAGLLAAELLRVRFEERLRGDPASRGTLGEQIDVMATEALGLLSGEPDSSERARTEADLVATMIRSDFRAKKYEGRFNAAVARARRLDPRNARAVVTSAKPLLFAPPGHGRDVPGGIALLDEALRLDPRLEGALLLRAWAHQKLGDRAAAAADWRAALSLNPECTPARKGLAGQPGN